MQENERPNSSGCNMIKKLRISELRHKKAYILVLLIITVIVALGALSMYNVKDKNLRALIQDTISRQLPEKEAQLFDAGAIHTALNQMKRRVVAAILLILFCVAVTLYVIVRTIIEPLSQMAKVTHRMAQGHLDEMVPVNSNDEIGKIGEFINDLSINIQEILLHVWNHTKRSQMFLDRIDDTLLTVKDNCLPAHMKENFENIRQDIEDIQAMVQSFELYDIRFEEGKVLAGEDPMTKYD